ncbi:MAG: hypothetical protein ACREN8_13160, partial [Candidatus Dormibacteraceae bacterium]
PPTVPPETDLPTWQASLQTLRQHLPTALALPHFGLHTDVEQHLAAASELLEQMAEQAARLEQEEFESWLDEVIDTDGGPSLSATYKQAGRPNILWSGLRRYLKA